MLVGVVSCLPFLSSLDNDFTNWDDDKYVTGNPVIRELSWENVKATFGKFYVGTYCPLVILSYALEYSLWGLNPFGYHLTNLLLHVGNSLLVFCFILQLSGQTSVALVTALLFGVHPLHVESVAWVAERKDVLSTLFFLGSLLCYLRYQKDRQTRFYALSLVTLLLSLLAKPMAVTLPFILLLCDYLALRKVSGRVILEKAPFFALSLFFGAIMIVSQGAIRTVSQHFGEALDPTRSFAFLDHLLIACRGLCFYLAKTLVPIHLSAFYPYPYNISLYSPTFFLPLILLLALATGVWISRRYTRTVIFGNLFFCITLLPVLKIIPIGETAAADRYMYIPSIGLFYLVGLAGHRLFVRETRWKRVKRGSLGLGLSTLLVVFSVLTWQRCNVWQDSETLWRDVLAKYPEVLFAHYNLGNFYREKNLLDAAIAEYKEALAVRPNDAQGHNNLGLVYAAKGQVDAAITEYKEALAVRPNHVQAHNNLGAAYAAKGQIEEAIAEYKAALAINPNSVSARANLGEAYRRKGLLDAAVAEYQQVLVLNPRNAPAHMNLGGVYVDKGQLDAAIAEYRQALALNPRDALIHYNLGNAYEKTGQLDAAIAEYQQALVLTPNFTLARVNLGSVYGKKGQFDAAIAEYQKALAISPNEALIHYSLAVAYYYKEEYKSALYHHDRALELGYPGQPQLAEVLKPYRD
jgi:tetratricopeptide (TPR) repeat protein